MGLYHSHGGSVKRACRERLHLLIPVAQERDYRERYLSQPKGDRWNPDGTLFIDEGRVGELMTYQCGMLSTAREKGWHSQETAMSYVKYDENGKPDS